MAMVTEQDRETFQAQGYVVMADVCPTSGLPLARRSWRPCWPRGPRRRGPGAVGPYFLWPRFEAADHRLLDFYHATGIGTLATGLLRPGLEVMEPGFAQVATTIPHWPHRPGGPHADGLTPASPDGRPGTFTMLAGVWLTDQTERDRGNLWIWPGTHLRFGRYLAERGAEALTRTEEMNPGPYPRIELGEPVQAVGRAGSVLFAHYLLAHNIGGHAGPPGSPPRQTIYYHLHATNHTTHWREAVTTPLLEFQ